MKSNLISKLVLFFFTIGFLYLCFEPTYTPTALLTPANHTHFPQHIAHKARVSGESTGNTLKSIQEALASYVEGLEIDIRLSKDGVPFLYHGETLEEATNGYGIPEDHNWEQLQLYVYNHDPDSRLIALEEVLSLVGSQKFIFLDIKSDKICNKVFSNKLAELIQKHHLYDTVIVESFNPFFLHAMRRKDPHILLMYDFTTNAVATGEEVQAQFDKIPWLLKQPFFQKQVRRLIRPDILGPRYNIKKSELQFFIEHGYPVIAWTVDDPEIARQLFETGVKGLQSNQPLKLLEISPLQPKMVYDAGGTKRQPCQIIHIKNIQDVVQAITQAKITSKKITIAAQRHSMGGQTLLDDSIQLNMLGLNSVRYNAETKTVTAGSGATWKKIQSVLDQNGRSVKVMQSDNIFSLGGSLSVNAHGWQVGSPPIASTVVSMTVVTADGKIHTVSLTKEPELFAAVLGGYGLFGVIVEAELETVPNSNVTFHAKYMRSEDFLSQFETHVTKNPNTELAYGRLSVDSENLFEKVGLFWYETNHESSSEMMSPEGLVKLKRAIFRSSEVLELGKKLRWTAERIYAQKMIHSGVVSRNNAMNTDIHILWPVYGKNKDILQEYFVPKHNLTQFLRSLRKNILGYRMNVLNVTIREVRKDHKSLLPYAKKDMFALVCLFSQKQEANEETKMKQFTEEVIANVLVLGGSFYLPYRLHYTHEQLLEAYPSMIDWIGLKRKWDPEEIFDNEFFQFINTSV